MKHPKHLGNKQKQERPPVDWSGLGNEPRNEKLAGIRGRTSFEKDEDDQDNREQAHQRACSRSRTLLGQEEAVHAKDALRAQKNRV